MRATLFLAQGGIVASAVSVHLVLRHARDVCDLPAWTGARDGARQEQE